MTSAEIVKLLKLEPLLPEGGYFRETYRSSYSTAIYYLITPDTKSALHRLPHDEIWHFYAGDRVQMLQLAPDGTSKAIILGNNLTTGEEPQVLVPAGVWQGAHLIEGGHYALLGTTMAPGFKQSEFELGNQQELLEQWPQESELIMQLT